MLDASTTNLGIKRFLRNAGNKKDFVIAIPARLKSTRLNRKPLADICGQPMILHTCQRALEVTTRENIYVLTDSSEIEETCKAAGFNCFMTSEDCQTGTDRIAEFASKFSAKVYINLQGDEPIMDSANIQKIIDAALDEPEKIINGWARIERKTEYFSRKIPKVVVDENGDLMYMSRSPVPGNKLNQFINAKKQVCVYSFPLSAMQFLKKNSHKTTVEKHEDIEILRFLEMGWRIKMIELSGSSVPVDTLQDLQKVRKIMLRQKS